MLELIDLDIEALGYTRFISSWLYQGEEGSFLVDPGPTCTVDGLLESLEKKGVNRLDWILLTHIHMDHAGGVGHVSRQFPEARISCHEKAVSHLIDPTRLWEGTKQVLGEIADVYGPMAPVDGSRTETLDALDFGEGIRVIPTPGHAAHHQSFVFGNWLFCGELFGLFHDLGEEVYLRPATPPKFIHEEFTDAMDRIAPEMNRQVCFAHYGMHPDGNRILSMARKQLDLWVSVVRRHAENPDIDAIIADLKAEDPVFARASRLPQKIYEREMYYSGNSIRGMLQYIREQS